MNPHILIYVASSPQYPLTIADLPAAPITWLKKGWAAEIYLEDYPTDAVLRAWREQAAQKYMDVFILPDTPQRRKKLLLADMDATIVEGETLDDLAAACGLKDEISAITARAMRGELDFHEALTLRVSKLAGLSVAALDHTLQQMRLTQGARDMVQVMRYYGAHCVLVSGGFTFFTEAIAGRCGFHNHHGNLLEIDNEHLTGCVVPPILDKHAKLTFLRDYIRQLNINDMETIAVGDGANDIPMLEHAGLGVGYRPKPLVKEHVQNCVVYADHMALLYMQGYDDEAIQTALSRA